MPVEVLTARDVPLGGPRAMTVHRTLPQRGRSMIGAWCFADHYGPDDVTLTGGMDVAPHPHIGLQTVSWLFAGEIEHNDSMGTHAMVRPGELNLMTAGHGIAHSEVSTPGTVVLHGMQLWVALPAESAGTARDFTHHVPPVVESGAARIRVLLGELAGHRSPVHTFSPLLGAEITLPPDGRVELPLDPGYEHGLIVDTGRIEVAGAGCPPLAATELGYLRAGHTSMTLSNLSSRPGRVVLIGGEPLDEDIVMWWNFVGRTHDDVATARREWTEHSDRFGEVPGYRGPVTHLPAPALPDARLRPRGATSDSLSELRRASGDGGLA